MKLERIQTGLEEHQPPATHGFFIGLWISDVMFAAEYWSVRAVQLGLWSVGVVRRNILAVAGGLFVATSFSAYAAFSTDCSGHMAISDLRAISRGVDLFHEEHGALPGDAEALVPHYLRELHADNWGTPYRFIFGANAYAVVSAGPDRLFGTGDDILVTNKFDSK